MNGTHGSRGRREAEMSNSFLLKTFSSNTADSYLANKPTDEGVENKYCSYISKLKFSVYGLILISWSLYSLVSYTYINKEVV